MADSSNNQNSAIKDDNISLSKQSNGVHALHTASQPPPLTATGTVLRTPAGNVRPLVAPPLPAVVPGYNQPATQYLNGFSGYRSGVGTYGGYGGYGGSYNNYGTTFGGYGSGYFGTTPSSYGYRGYPYDYFGGGLHSNNAAFEPEARFIQMAEESTKSAFQSIESLVMTIGNIATMLDSTFFALTSSFRAVLGVAANFGRLRGVFAQFWHNFVLFRGIIWIYRKLLYFLRLSKWDSSSDVYKKAFAEAFNAANAQCQGSPAIAERDLNRTSPWPVVLFISFILTAPYMIMKLLGNVTSSTYEDVRNSKKWINPVETSALYDFQARNQSELSLFPGQRVLIAPKEVQQNLRLLNTGWALAAVDAVDNNGTLNIADQRQLVGLIPINYVKSPQQLHQEQEQQQQQYRQQQQQHSTVKDL